MPLDVKIFNRKLAKTNVSRNLERQKEKEKTKNLDEAGPSGLSGSAGPSGNAERVSSKILTNRTFQSLSKNIASETLRALEEIGFSHMTEIQAQTIDRLLEGKNLVATAKTGSGKTLAFLIPAIELVYKLKLEHWRGTGAIILCPTRELCIQTFGLLKELMKYHRHTYGLLLGGKRRKAEADKLWNGVNIIVATPGRLLDHMKNTKDFMYTNTCCLVIDEADLMLDIGFEDELRQIVDLLPKTRQTMLFSATEGKKIESLASLVTTYGEQKYLAIDEKSETPTVAGVNQGYIICPSELRGMYLYTFLSNTRKKKVIVFFSSWMTVHHYDKLYNYMELKVMSIHGKQSQEKRTKTFLQFCNAKAGTLLCTNVAARGLDIPAVQWIFQFDPPGDAQEYIHRVGRTARGEGCRGRAFMMLRPEELEFRKYLFQAKIPLNIITFDYDKIHDCREEVQDLMTRIHYLRRTAQDAFIGYVRSYKAHRLKDVYNADTLDLKKVAMSFGLTTPPPLDAYVDKRKGHKRKNNSFQTKYNKKPRKHFEGRD